MLRRGAIVLACCAAGCGTILGLGVDEAVEKDTAPADDAATTDAESAGGDTTAPVDGDAGSVDASIDATVDAKTEDAGPIGCNGDAGCVRYVFVTSTAFAGTTLGLAGADTHCNTVAKASPLAKIKQRTFVAWISTSTKDAKNKLEAEAPIKRVDETIVTSDLATLLASGPSMPIDVDEKGAVITNSDVVWTGTQNTGTVNNTCSDWQNPAEPAKTGSATAVNNGAWTDDGTKTCNESARLYCFEK